MSRKFGTRTDICDCGHAHTEHWIEDTVDDPGDSSYSLEPEVVPEPKQGCQHGGCQCNGFYRFISSEAYSNREIASKTEASIFSPN